MPDREMQPTARVPRVVQPPSVDLSKESEVPTTPVERDVVDRVTCRAGDASCATAHASTINRATDSKPSRAEHSLLQLQRQYGNRYVERVLSLAREDAGEENSGTGVSPGVEGAIQQKRGGGNSLDSGVRKQMEGALGADFSGVRVHTDAQSHELNQSLSARAFTTGQDIFFRQGAYEPGSSTGRELIAHELTHVVQQGGSVRRAMDVSQPGDPHEVEAEQTARAVMQGESAGSKTHEEEEKEKHSALAGHLSASVQRQPEAPKKDEEEEKKKHHAMMKADRFKDRATRGDDL